MNETAGVALNKDDLTEVKDRWSCSDQENWSDNK